MGPVLAGKLYSSGIRSIEQLRARQGEFLNANQTVGLKYYEDFLERMPREEAGLISETVQKTARELFGATVKVIACGSYRRGRPTCGDVDILITRTDHKQVKGMCERLVVRLEEIGFLKERLSMSAGSLERHREMYMGVCLLPGYTTARRIDIKVYPKEQYGFALLYFTGSDYFNRSMRLFSDRKGFTLSDHGLIPVAKTASGSKVSKGIGIPCQTEEEVFKALGLPYKTPAERDL